MYSLECTVYTVNCTLYTSVYNALVFQAGTVKMCTSIPLQNSLVWNKRNIPPPFSNSTQFPEVSIVRLINLHTHLNIMLFAHLQFQNCKETYAPYPYFAIKFIWVKIWLAAVLKSFFFKSIFLHLPLVYCSRAAAKICAFHYAGRNQSKCSVRRVNFHRFHNQLLY